LKIREGKKPEGGAAFHPTHYRSEGSTPGVSTEFVRGIEKSQGQPQITEFIGSAPGGVKKRVGVHGLEVALDGQPGKGGNTRQQPGGEGEKKVRKNGLRVSAGVTVSSTKIRMYTRLKQERKKRLKPCGPFRTGVTTKTGTQVKASLLTTNSDRSGGENRAVDGKRERRKKVRRRLLQSCYAERCERRKREDAWRGANQVRGKVG